MSSEAKHYTLSINAQEALFRYPIQSRATKVGGSRIGRMNKFFGEYIKRIEGLAKEHGWDVRISRKEIRNNFAIVTTMADIAAQLNDILGKEHRGYLHPARENPTVLRTDEDLTKFLNSK